MRNYRVEYIDPRDDSIINIEYVSADLFMVDDDHVIVTFFVEISNAMTPVAMFPFANISCITTENVEEGDSE